MRSVVVLVCVGAGCKDLPAPAPSASVGERTSATTEWIYEGDDTAIAGVDLAVLQTDLQAQIDLVPFWNGAPLKASYAAARTRGDSACPAEEGLDDPVMGRTTWWYGACSTSAGVHFNGAFTRWDWDGDGLAATDVQNMSGRLPEGYTYTGGGFEGRIDIYDEGGGLDFGCSCHGMTGSGASEDGSTLTFSFARGPATWSGGEADDSWLLTPEILPSVWQLYTTLPAENARVARADASLSGVGERYQTSQFSIDLRSDLTDRTCLDAHLSGLVRDSFDASWIAVEAAQRAAGECVTCFTVDGAGDVCVDLHAIRDADLPIPDGGAW